MQGGGSAANSVPPSSGAFDKSKVLDVKPIRMLKPIFPTDGHSLPLNVRGPPVAPAYPFVEPQSTPPPAAAPTPLRSFRVPESNGNVEESEGRKHISHTPKRTTKKKVRGSDPSIPLAQDFIVPINATQREDGNKEVVDLVWLAFDGVRRKLSQFEDVRAANGTPRRSDLKAGNILMSKGLRTNMNRRVGAVPGVHVGDIFFFRMELCVLGIHAPSMSGIDYILKGSNGDDDPVALSIVSSAYYDNETGDKDVLVYSGQGGGITPLDKEASDQKMERGNLALERSLHRGNEVRVIRGMRDGTSKLSNKIYMYDGLYTIQESWTEKGKHGTNIFKYKFVRISGQPDAFSVWKSIEKWKGGVSSCAGLIAPDLTSGTETIPVALVNTVDNDKGGPAYFTYFPSVRFMRPQSSSFSSSHSCKCQSSCNPGDLNCSCIQINEGEFPYTGNGVLVRRKALVQECGPSCQCPSSCKNRVTQSGLKFQLEVFKTKEKGWGLRSWDPIRAGSFICVYAGEFIDKARLKQRIQEEEDEYIFDTSRVYDPFKWNDPGLLQRGADQNEEDYNLASPLIITAKTYGNVARFMNHSCYPNVFWQPVGYVDSNQSFVHIAFYAIKHIPPMTELTYDYGVVASSEEGHHFRTKKCICGSSNCRGYFGL